MLRKIARFPDCATRMRGTSGRDKLKNLLRSRRLELLINSEHCKPGILSKAVRMSEKIAVREDSLPEQQLLVSYGEQFLERLQPELQQWKHEQQQQDQQQLRPLRQREVNF